jgi:YgiT-type zinc finger domain-containing protein
LARPEIQEEYFDGELRLEMPAEMLTRTSRGIDFASSASLYPVALDPVRGERQLEELAFEVCSEPSRSTSLTKGVDRLLRTETTMTQCHVCGSTQWKAGLVSEVFEVNGKRVLVEDIPARVCVRCGEESFCRETTERIRRMVQAKRGPYGRWLCPLSATRRADLRAPQR